MKAFSEEIYKSVVCDFLLMVTMAILLNVCKIFSYIELEKSLFAHCIVILDPWRKKAQQYQRKNSAKIRTYSSSWSSKVIDRNRICNIQLVVRLR